MVSFTGFNPDDVVQSIKKMNSTYIELCNLYNKSFKLFLDEISRLWACQEAQSYFNLEFKNVADNLKETIELQFSKIINLMNSSAQKWAEASHENFTQVLFPGQLMKEIDTTVIKSKIDGNIGLSIDLAIQSVKKFQTNINTQFNSVLNKCILISSGFLGGNQQEAINNKVSIIQKEITRNISNVIQDLNNKIEKTANEYNDNSLIIEKSINDQ